MLAAVGEHVLRVLARPHFLGEGFVLGDDFPHFFFDGGKILRRERLVAEEIVIKSVLDHRPNGHLRAGPQRLYRFRQYMRAIVTDQFERARVVAGDEFDLGVALDLVGQVCERAVERHRDRALGKRRRDAFRDLETGGAGGVLTARAVRKSQRDHVALHSLLPTNAGKRSDSGDS